MLTRKKFLVKSNWKFFLAQLLPHETAVHEREETCCSSLSPLQPDPKHIFNYFLFHASLPSPQIARRWYIDANIHLSIIHSRGVLFAVVVCWEREMLEAFGKLTNSCSTRSIIEWQTRRGKKQAKIEIHLFIEFCFIFTAFASFCNHLAPCVPARLHLSGLS